MKIRKPLAEPADIHAVGYVRVSTGLQVDEGYGLAAQEDTIRHYCLAQGWQLGRIYSDGGVSGMLDQRPALDEMRRDISRGGIQRVVAAKLDRLGRNAAHVLELYNEIERLSAGVVCVKEQIDTSTPLGRMFRTVMAAMAEFEREVILDRLDSGIRAKIRGGGMAGGYVPLGYQRTDEGFIVDPHWGPVVQQIFTLRAQGWKLWDIAHELDSQGIKTLGGGPWRASSIHVVLNNPIYTGKAAWDKRGTPVHSEIASVPALVT